MSSWIRQPNDNDRLLFRQLEIIFAEYPPSVTKAVTDPLTGMQRQVQYEKYAPSVAQIIKELNREMEFFRLKAAEHQVKRIANERESDEGRPPLNPEHLRYWLNRDPATMPDPVPVKANKRGGKQSTDPPQPKLMTSEDEKELTKQWS